ncbi:MAG: hypothetical protein ACD_39C01401G0005 [uncultured bacterium]|nr:MAG: hypothetical protein ACD_39C01401G0005 [uncultured bacterium]
MTYLQKITQAVAVFLLLMMNTILVIPSGIDLELCLGKDGHIDFSLNSCQDSPSSKTPVRQHPPTYTATHHDNCLHIALACGNPKEAIRTDGKTDSQQYTLNKAPSMASFILNGSLTGSANMYLGSNGFFIPFENLTSPHLVSLRTVFLLI